ncbi:hypothetical protein ES707_14781 [subsurface metagenome]
MNECINCNKKAILIAVTIVLLAVIFMFFRDRQQKRELQSERLDTQMGVWEEWGPLQQNRQLNNATDKSGGKIL